mmetsp:Transcript_34432/g.80623  ORF Transcript_34432/g.80623 Transcript_34432/m.80623 type:complete len:394 (-) Transcript_34432:205-1386(-)|eukprot:CAMPEP_0119367090 /NCGR_PEP_ID=MMETSP1334-20130426/13897_1 /TAXON_ID=127549 /ORGANISM="Calcidiscus leptoporus, Strain RCC1130" /LENGTH=393 /DNA_ID=CAMNT_0007383421 /DNA_START=135 /DNA_END=1316 /DNA_ORIENTATION=-
MDTAVRTDVRSHQGVRLAKWTWRAAEPKAAILLHHGLGASSRFDWLRASERGGVHDSLTDSLIASLIAAGITVVSYDCQSHGESESIRPARRCYFERFDDLAWDLLDAHDALRRTLPDEIPIFWGGGSMGGGVVVRTSMLRDRIDAAGIILLAPMLSLTKVREEYIVPALGIKNGHLRPVLDLFSRWLPTLPVVARPENTLNPHLDAEFKAEPSNYLGAVRVRPAAEFTLFTEALMDPRRGPRALERVSCRDLLCVHALADTFVEPQGTVAAFERAKVRGLRTMLLIGRAGGEAGELRESGGASGTPPPEESAAREQLRALTDLGMWHALTQEPGAEKLGSAVAAWIIESAGRLRAEREAAAARRLESIALVPAAVLPEPLLPGYAIAGMGYC